MSKLIKMLMEMKCMEKKIETYMNVRIVVDFVSLNFMSF